MKWIKRFKELNGKVDRIHESRQTESEVAKICRKYNIKINGRERQSLWSWSLNSDGLVDVDGNVFIIGKKLEPSNKLTELPLKFGTITGSFICYDNFLTSLEGAPHTVGGDFNVDNNELTSFEFAPKSVVGNFLAHNNNIRSFEGLVNIGGYLNCGGSNPVDKIWKIISNSDFQTHSMGRVQWDNEKMEFFNDLDIIRGDEIAIERLNFFLEEFGLDPVESVKGYKNIY